MSEMTVTVRDALLGVYMFELGLGLQHHHHEYGYAAFSGSLAMTVAAMRHIMYGIHVQLMLL
jgi:hypothetical protein